jgi:sodium/hydrogen antiporter
MSAAAMYVLIGILLIAVVVVASKLERLPLSETMIYLAAGVTLGPVGLHWFAVDALAHVGLLHRLAEFAVISSLFCAGLKLRTSVRDPIWRIPVRLAFVSMALTVGLIAAVAHYALGFPLGPAVLLGAVLAPTDPVLASGVQVENAADRDRVRFSLTGEAGLNDGTAFPFVMLGLGLSGLHELGALGWRWFAVDVVWAIVAGLGIGALLGKGTAYLVLWLRRTRHEAVGRDEFLALGLIALAYGAALLVHAYGFLAVFAAGLALRTVERQHTGNDAPADVVAMEAVTKADATHPERASAHMAGAVLAFNEQIDRILEVAMVLLVGVALWPSEWQWRDAGFLALLFLVIRPLAVLLGLAGSHTPHRERGLMAWLGIRGIGSLYYLMFAIERGLPREISERFVAITLLVVAVSIVVHGITVSPLMNAHRIKAGDRSRDDVN